MGILIGDKLKMYRENKGMSMSELGHIVGVSKQSIHRYENNVKSPSSSTLIEISQALNVHPSDFFSDSSNKIEITDINFRDKIKLYHLEQEVDDIQTICKNHINNLIELEQLLDDIIEFKNPIEGIKISNASDVEKAAKKLRTKWKLGSAPIHSATEVIEENGIIIIEVDAHGDFTGLTGKANQTIPFIAINKNFSESTRKRFTLLHELGHIVLDFIDQLEIEDIEKLCNHFAGAILLVGDTLKNELGTSRTAISLKELKSIKEKYGISIQAIIFRAKAIGYISERSYFRWWDSYNQWHNNLSGSSEFGTYNSDENVKLFDSLIMKGLIEKRITWGKAANLKETKVDILKTQLNELNFKVA